VREAREEGLGRRLPDHAERGEGEPFDHDLHAEELHVPARVFEDEVEQRLQVDADGVAPPDFWWR